MVKNQACLHDLRLICSEIFCGVKQFSQDKPTFFACNDVWLGCDYARALAKNAAQLCAMRYGVPIIYVGSFDLQILK